MKQDHDKDNLKESHDQSDSQDFKFIKSLGAAKGKRLQVVLLLGLCIVLTVGVFAMDSSNVGLWDRYQMGYDDHFYARYFDIGLNGPHHNGNNPFPGDNNGGNDGNNGGSGNAYEQGKEQEQEKAINSVALMSFAIDGYEVRLNRNSEHISLLVSEDADLDHILIEFALDRELIGARLYLGEKELQSGNYYSLSDLESRHSPLTLRGKLTLRVEDGAELHESGEIGGQQGELQEVEIDARNSQHSNAQLSSNSQHSNAQLSSNSQHSNAQLSINPQPPASNVHYKREYEQLPTVLPVAEVSASNVHYKREYEQLPTVLPVAEVSASNVLFAREYELHIHRVDTVVETGLPVVVINTDGERPVVDKVYEHEAQMAIIDGKLTPYGEGLYHGPLTIRGRGNSSWTRPKKAYKIEPAKNVQLLDMPSDDDWVLIGNYADKTLMRNYIAYEFARSLDMAYSPRMRFVELFLNGEYLGNFIIGEQIKIAENRLNLNRMWRVGEDGETLTGGYIIEKDWLSRIDETDHYFPMTRFPEDSRGRGDNIFVIKRPSAKRITSEQIDYITRYFNEAEDALYSDHFTDQRRGLWPYFDVDSFVDWYIVNELFKNVDADFGSSVYLYKDVDELIHFGPVWDFDYAAGNVNYNGADSPTGFYVKDGYWISRLLEDRAVVAKLQARWAEIKDVQVTQLLTLIRETEELLQRSAEANFVKWDILGKYVVPNPPGYEERTTFGAEVDYLVAWLEQRIAWLNEAIPEL